MTDAAFAVDIARCIRCGACSTLAPEIFSVRRGRSLVLRPPATDDERARAEVAEANCPTRAIRRREEPR